MLAILCPGQGAQTPGFLKSWCQISEFRQLLDQYSQAAKLDLADYGCNADGQTIKDTAIAQPLLTAAAIGIFRLLYDFKAPGKENISAGHSVGEFGAAAISGVLDDNAAMQFVATRAQTMAKAAASNKTGMSAVLAGNETEVIERITECGLKAANFNGKGQLVAAGSLENLAKLSENPPAHTRVVPLSVAGAFHTEYMATALTKLAEVASTLTVTNPTNKLLSNRDGAIITEGTEYVMRLVSQICQSVRWDLCMKTMLNEQITGIIELAPAGTLTGIAKRNMRGVELFNLNEPAQLSEAKAFAVKHES